MNETRDIKTECWSCQFQCEVPGDAHIKCANPDPDMTGDPHGIKYGWFYYPLLFDPTWKTKLCANYKSNKKEEGVEGKKEVRWAMDGDVLVLDTLDKDGLHEMVKENPDRDFRGLTIGEYISRRYPGAEIIKDESILNNLPKGGGQTD